MKDAFIAVHGIWLGGGIALLFAGHSLPAVGCFVVSLGNAVLARVLEKAQ